MTSPSDGPMLSVPQFAKRIGVSQYTVRKWIKQSAIRAVNINIGGKLPVYRIGGDQIEAVINRIELQEKPSADNSGGDGVLGGSPGNDEPEY